VYNIGGESRFPEGDEQLSVISKQMMADKRIRDKRTVRSSVEYE